MRQLTCCMRLQIIVYHCQINPQTLHTNTSQAFTMFASGRTTTAARQTIRSFSTTRLCRSKIGSAPLSVPPEVKFNIIQPAALRAGKQAISKEEQGSTVEISGPLGTMKYEIPAYMSIQENEDNRTRTLSILDANDRKQREMWGE